MSRRLLRFAALAVSSSLVVAACGGSQESSRTRNVTRGDGYEVPRVLLYEYEDVLDRSVSREWGAGYTTAGPSNWDPKTYDIGQGRARVAGPIYEEIGPRVPPRANRPGPVAPPIYERPVTRGSTASSSSRLGTTTPKVGSGASMKTGNLGKLVGGLGNIGSTMAGSIAMAGIGMALGALGAPPFLMSLFGGPDAATMAMLEAIMDMLKEMDKKLDTIIEKLDAVQVSVNDIGSSIQLLAGNVCAASVTSTATKISDDLIDPIDASWMDLFVNNTIEPGENTSNAFTKDQADYLDSIQKRVDKIDAIAAIERLESMFLGNSDLATKTDSQSGLLSQVQACTLAKKRYLTNEDTARWQSLALLVMLAQGRAAQLATWNEIYTAMEEKRSPNLTTLNLINLTLRHSMSNIGFHVSMQIPEGQMLDTVTNKMWRFAPSGTSKVGLQEALTACLPDEERFVNYAPVPSWSGTATRDLNMCVATKEEAEKTTGGKPSGSPLDRGVGISDTRGSLLKEGDWRIPTAGEITVSGPNFNSTVKPGTAGLIDAGANKAGGSFLEWKSAKCGPSRNVVCTTPADYLATYGYSGVPADLGIVWSNTTYTRIGEGGKNKTAAWTTQQTWDSYNNIWNPSGNGLYGFCEDDNQMAGGQTKIACGDPDGFFAVIDALSYGTVPRIPGPIGTTATPAQRDNFCFRVTSDKTPNGRPKNNWYNPFTPEVAVVNLGVTGTNAGPVSIPVKGKPGQTVSITAPKNYRETKPGEQTAYFASRQVTNASIACRHDWYASTTAKLPQTAQALWVRNLAPDEAYYSVTGDLGPQGVPELRSFQRTLQPASVSILSMNGQAVIHSRMPRNTSDTKYFVKCVINPEVDPLTPDDVLAAGTDCPRISFTLDDGPYRVYAVTARQQGGRTVTSNLEIADIALSSKFAEIPGVTPPVVAPEPTVTAPAQIGIAGTASSGSTPGSSAAPSQTDMSTTTLPKGLEGAADTPSTSSTTKSIDLGTLMKRAKFKPKAGDKIRVTVAKSSRAICRYQKPNVIGIAAGRCKLTLTLTSKKSKKTKVFDIAVGNE